MRVTPEATIRHFRERGWWGDTLVHDLFRANAAKTPDRVALVDPPNRAELTGDEPVRWTYAELAGRVDALSAALVGLGLEPDDVVVAQLPNVAEYVALYLAASELGVVMSPVPMQFREHELRQVASLVRPKAYVATTRFKDQRPLAAIRAVAGDALVLAFGPDAPAGVVDLAAAAAAADPAARERRLARHRPSGDDVYTICWTSGTEGVPKGVPRSHNHWLTIGVAHYDGAKIAPGDRLLNPFPLVNMAAIGGCFMSWLQAGGTLILHHPLDLGVYLRQIAVERPEYAIAPPAVLNLLLKDEALLAKCDLSSLRCIGSGSAPLAPSMIAGYRDRFGIHIVNNFGSNEGVSLVSGPDEAPEPELRARYFPRFGRPDVAWPQRIAERMESRIVDPATGAEIEAPGQPGELQIRGPAVFDGYWLAPELTKASFTADGWFRTGDLFQVAPEGGGRYYEFVGRLKQLIIRGGVKISPEELDNLLAAHPALAEAAVVGYPDAVMGERVCVVAVPKPGQTVTLEDVKGFLEQRQVSRVKWPERLVTLPALPRNAVGKVVRTEIAQAAAQPPGGAAQ